MDSVFGFSATIMVLKTEKNNGISVHMNRFYLAWLYTTSCLDLAYVKGLSTDSNYGITGKDNDLPSSTAAIYLC